MRRTNSGQHNPLTKMRRMLRTLTCAKFPKIFYTMKLGGFSSSSTTQRETEMMGSTALISHLQPNCCFHRLDSTRTLNSLQKSSPSTSKSGFLRISDRSRKQKGRCSAAVEGGKDQQQQVLGSVGSVVEERPQLENSQEGIAENAQEGILQNVERGESSLYNLLYPSKDDLPDDKEMSIFDHLEELRERLFVSVLAVGGAMLGCFVFSKELIFLLEAPVSSQGVRFLQLSPGEFFFTTLKVSGYCGLLVGSPVILYEIIAFILPGLTKAERRFLGPIVLGSSVLFYAGIFFSYSVLAPAALSFFVSYAEGAVESLWSIDQYFEFVLVLLFSTGLSFQVPVIQLLLGQTGLVSGDQMLSIWRYVVVGAVVAAAVLTPSTDPLTQMLLAGPLLGLYLGGAWTVKAIGR
ncbi:sec-independent protein translocase protein TATC, chloroplastic [Cinnamomum micranthum f. kanehirae]|uniref:Sec-independent protein translocase protein TATC, chloroplastic n=1 Tax=Cinnamomum micranthum f. kanehirae TaxID=337451 RepID=A0A3S3R1M0_9MAGN|nr:sec-independent protein translocase protein TATC, chloroplastic [Cinnamomum micranthum f. kanehirae]